MQREFDVAEVHIPYGVLHDQTLENVQYEQGCMTLTFSVRIFPEDYPDETFQKYAEFRHCDMIVSLPPEPFLYFYLETCPDRRGRFHGWAPDSEQFLDVVRHAGALTFLECSAACRELQLEFAADFRAAKGKYRKYRKAAVCRVLLDAEKVQWKWY